MDTGVVRGRTSAIIVLLTAFFSVALFLSDDSRPQAGSSPPVEVRTLGRDKATGGPALAIAYGSREELDRLREGRGIRATWSPDGRRLVCWWDSALWRWDRQAGWRCLVSGVGPTWFEGWLSHPTRILLGVDWDNLARRLVLLDPETGKTQVLLNNQKLALWLGGSVDLWDGYPVLPNYQFEVAPDGSLVAVYLAGIARGYVAFFNSQVRAVGRHEPGFLVWEERPIWEPRARWHPQAGWSHDGRWFAVINQGSHTMLLIEPRKGTLRNEWFRDYPGLGMWSPHGDLIALLTTEQPAPWCTDWYGGTLALFEMASGKVRRYPALGEVQLPLWSPDGRRIAVALQTEADGGEAQLVGIFDVPTRRLHAAKPLLRSCRDSGEWSPDGRYFGFGPGIVHCPTWKVTLAKPGQKHLPASPTSRAWVWRLFKEEGEEGVVCGEWVRLQMPWAYQTWRGHLCYWEAYGVTERKSLGPAERVVAWWHSEAPGWPLGGQIGNPPG